MPLLIACVFSHVRVRTTPLSEKQEVLFPSNFGTVVLLSQGERGGIAMLDRDIREVRAQRAASGALAAWASAPVSLEAQGLGRIASAMADFVTVGSLAMCIRSVKSPLHPLPSTAQPQVSASDEAPNGGMPGLFRRSRTISVVLHRFGLNVGPCYTLPPRRRCSKNMLPMTPPWGAEREMPPGVPQVRAKPSTMIINNNNNDNHNNSNRQNTTKRSRTEADTPEAAAVTPIENISSALRTMPKTMDTAAKVRLAIVHIKCQPEATCMKPEG